MVSFVLCVDIGQVDVVNTSPWKSMKLCFIGVVTG